MTATNSMVTYHRKARAFIVVLASPPANALGPPVIDGLQASLDAFDDSDARVLLLRSDLPGFFAAGADIKLMKNVETAGFVEYGFQLPEVIERVAVCDRPSIAVIEGWALGGGLELALAATLRVGSATARLGLPEPKLGLIAGAGGAQRLPRLIGRGRALDIMLTARDVSAEEALRIGLLDRLTAGGQAESIALTLANTIAAMSPPALTAILRSVDDADDLHLEEGLTREANRESDLFDKHDGREGVRAFVEGRRPAFS
jgi:enoyl-CoA hydratase